MFKKYFSLVGASVLGHVSLMRTLAARICAGMKMELAGWPGTALTPHRQQKYPSEKSKGKLCSFHF
jgi:hypothetical protein